MTTTRIDDNIVSTDDGGTACAHCHEVLSSRGETHLQRARIRTGAANLAGPQVRLTDPPVIDEEVEFRQLLCPACGTALLTEIVATKDVATRTATLAVS